MLVQSVRLQSSIHTPQTYPTPLCVPTHPHRCPPSARPSAQRNAQCMNHALCSTHAPYVHALPRCAPPHLTGEDDLDKDLADELRAVADPQRAQKLARHFELAWKISNRVSVGAGECGLEVLKCHHHVRWKY